MIYCITCNLQEAEERRKKLEKELEADSSNKVHFTPVTIAFLDLEYFVPNPNKREGGEVRLLRGVTGSMQPGAEVLAVAGDIALASSMELAHLWARVLHECVTLASQRITRNRDAARVLQCKRVCRCALRADGRLWRRQDDVHGRHCGCGSRIVRLWAVSEKQACAHRSLDS
jgi:hypothetical protein